MIVGIPATGERLDLDFGEFNRREKFLTGTMYGSEDPAVALPMLLDHVRAGRLKLRELLGPTLPARPGERGVRRVARRRRRPGAGHPLAVRVALISQVTPAVEGYTQLLRALGHEPVGVLCVRPGEPLRRLRRARRALSLAELDVVIPRSRERFAPLLRALEPDSPSASASRGSSPQR